MAYGVDASSAGASLLDNYSFLEYRIKNISTTGMPRMNYLFDNDAF
jgi:hypothetical protein